MPKEKTSFSLSSEALALLEALKKETGASKATLVEMAIRELARKHQVQAANNQHSERGA